MSEQLPPVDVIHDIGYRHYDGPRLGRGYATRSLYTLSLRGSFGLGRSIKSKILPMGLLALMCVPALIIVAVAVYLKSGKLPLEYERYLSIMDFVIAVFIASQAPVALSRDLRFMTLPLYFSRPITAGDYVRAKFAAMFSAMFVLTGLPLLIMWIGSLLASMGFAYNLEHFGYGLVGAALYSLLYSAIGLAVASATPRRGFGVAGIIMLLLISGAVATIIYFVINRHDQSAAAHWANVLSPSGLVDSSVTWMFKLPVSGATGVPSALGGCVFVAEALLLPAAVYGLLVQRYRKI
ncbi:ABC transporter permease [Streptacidiphilus sp. PB12-B1b]|uniref:ABC transporter permease n=1 Tax=Streptacidiphilus sp. PB12-B1b TaxID=2705012 RepID=UPI0015FD33C7|nr:ABC transporter permease [Streptacidiphilus sp. PB12-B1b]QMU74494.1 ABC transporter permease [Streptacidiphilus sp. PB12-B1b]